MQRMRFAIPTLAASLLLGSCVVVGAEGTDGPPELRGEAVEVERAEGATPGERVVTGVYVGRADGVDCARIETEGGELVRLSQVPPDIPLGTRLRVAGTMGQSLQCQGGTVLRVASLERA